MKEDDLIALLEYISLPSTQRADAIVVSQHLVKEGVLKQI